MRDEAIGRPDVQSLALAEPTTHVRPRWIVGLTLAMLGMWMAVQAPSQVVLALQLQDITPRHKIAALGVVTAVNAVSSALATPFVGALSDRTAHGRRPGRFSGRRHRWTLAMVLPAAVCVALLAKAGTVLVVALLWVLFGAGGVVVASIVGGVISDRTGRRKMLVTVSGLLMAVAALLLTFWETWPAALAAAVLFGIGFGAYIAVDQALITQVLPKAHDRAKDLGIINIAIVTPYAIGPAIAAPMVSLAGYPTLFGATAVVGIAAAIGVWRIKSVK